MHDVLDRYGKMEDLLKILEALVNEYGVKGGASLSPKEKLFLKAMELFHNEFLKLASRISFSLQEESECTALFGRMEVLLGKVKEPPRRQRKR